jgi:D-proline reductase (dithiol) PrdB
VAEFSELSLKYQLLLKAYPWRRIDPVPFTPLGKPLSECRVGLVTSAGLVPPGGEPFDESQRGGDPSWREIPGSIDVQILTESHRSDAFDHSGVAADRNLVFPLDRLRERLADRRIGSLAETHYSFMGSLTAVGRFVRHSAPEIALRLKAQNVDAAFLVPV